jgi:hypothetical protein
VTATEFARLLKARRIGKGKWQARCPAHPDRKPSLAIAEGRKGILLKCMSHGCETKDILGALGMTFADLFEGKPVDHVMMRQIRAAEEKHDEEVRKRRSLKLLALDERDRWERLANRLAERMAHCEDIDQAYFHRALFYMRRCESIADAFDFPCARQMS